MKNFLVHSDETIRQMCKEIGINTAEDLFKQIPQDIRIKELNLPDGLSEMETQRQIKQIRFCKFYGWGNL